MNPLASLIRRSSGLRLPVSPSPDSTFVAASTVAVDDGTAQL
jgi:hypothetical protein